MYVYGPVPSCRLGRSLGVRQMVENKELVNVMCNGEEYLLPGHFDTGK